ncbi:MAG: WxL domain-containing protein [Chloroflexi bacterium]|nr:WxL domain-containing protein [Chloroflexota bacterium]
MSTHHQRRIKRGTAAWLPLLALPLLVIVAGIGMFRGQTTAGAATITVVVGQNSGGTNGVDRYNPADITITTGDTVTWNSAPDGRQHDVTEQSGAWASPLLRSSGTNTWSRTFPTAGTYLYYCSLHSDPAEAAAMSFNTTMVGRITVNPPAPDTTNPTVSGVAASPNPTAGAAGVALSATVGDNIGVTQARYRIDGGASVAMSVVSTTASASIPTGALSLGVHTVEVQSEDAAGNVSTWVALSGGLDVTGLPAGAVTATISITGGGLSNSTSNITLPGITLTGLAQVVAAAPATPWNAVDARGTGAGWNVTVQSTGFSSTGGPMAGQDFKARLSAVTTVSGSAAPSTPNSSYAPLGTALKILQASAGGAGMGSYEYSPDFQLTVPASAAPGSYTASIAVTITSGP